MIVFGRIPIAQKKQPKGMSHNVPEFAAYSIAEGIKRAFTRFGKWIRTFAQTKTPYASTADAPMLPGFLEFFEVDYE